MAEQEFDPAMDAAEDRARAMAPRVLNLILDVLEGRKEIVVETVPDKAGNFLTSFAIIDRPESPPAETI